MIFADHEKRIYPGPLGKSYDPLALQREITFATGGNLAAVLDAWNAGLPAADGTGDAAIRRTPEQAVLAAQAEAKLAAVGRQVFGLPPFPEATDGEAIEALNAFWEYLEKKGGSGAGTPAG